MDGLLTTRAGRFWVLAVLASSVLEVIGCSGSQRSIEVSKSIARWPATSNRFALVVGVNTYSDPGISRLEGADNDARALADALNRFAGFPSDQVVVLTSDANDEGHRPTRGNLLRRISNIVHVVPSDGLLVFAFSGHGIEREGDGFLLPSDAQINGDIELLKDTALRVADLREKFRKSKVEQVVVFMDACRNDPSSARGDGDNALTPAFA